MADKPISQRPPMRNDLTAGHVRELLDYNPETGVLTWRSRPLVKRSWDATYAGKPAGYVGKDGNTVLGIQRRLYIVPRIIWLWMTGEWPKAEVDHKDTNPANNRWNNLRQATRLEQMQNRRRPVNNTSGFKWVSKRRGHWVVQVRANKQQHWRGPFDNPENAYEAACKLAATLHGAFVRFE